jgi:serralysin
MKIMKNVHFEGDWSIGRSYHDDLVYYAGSVDGDGGTAGPYNKPVLDADDVAFYLNRGDLKNPSAPYTIDADNPQSNFVPNTGAQWAGAKGGHNGIYDAIPRGYTKGAVLNELTYGFFDSRQEVAADPFYYKLGQARGFSPFDAAQRAATREAIEAWDDLIAVSFKEVDSSVADINFMNTTTGPIQASAYLPYNYGGKFTNAAGDVFINPLQPSNHLFDEGQYGLTTLVHELGHSLGLEHPGAYNFSANFDVTYENGAEYYQDSNQYSIMSYWDSEETGSNHVDWEFLTYRYSSTPSVHDVLAIQRIYGADMTTRTGDSVYGFNTTEETLGSFDFANNPFPVVTIWDAGGTDTLDLSGFDTPSVIDLNPGAFSSGGGIFSEEIPTLAAINAARAEAGLAPRSQATYDLYIELFADYYDHGLMTDNIAIAYGAVIENAVGGSGDDTINGNRANNRLTGGEGDDTFIFANDGSIDTITDFESGSDTIDLSGLGVTADDVEIDGGNVFANVDGVVLQIIAGGVQMSDINFAAASLGGETLTADSRYAYVIA